MAKAAVCKKCQKELKWGALVCPSCGAEVKKKSGTGSLILCLIIFAALAAGLYYCIKYRPFDWMKKNPLKPKPVRQIQ